MAAAGVPETLRCAMRFTVRMRDDYGECRRATEPDNLSWLSRCPVLFWGYGWHLLSFGEIGAGHDSQAKLSQLAEHQQRNPVYQVTAPRACRIARLDPLRWNGASGARILRLLANHRPQSKECHFVICVYKLYAQVFFILTYIVIGPGDPSAVDPSVALEKGHTWRCIWCRSCSSEASCATVITYNAAISA